MTGCIKAQSHPCNTERRWIVAVNGGGGSGGGGGGSVPMVSGGRRKNQLTYLRWPGNCTPNLNWLQKS